MTEIDLEKAKTILENTHTQLDRAIGKAEKIQEIVKIRGKRGYDGPFKEIDCHTQGIIEGKVYTIGAYSNTGKSQLAYEYVSYFLKQGKKVMFISTEVGIGDLIIFITRNLNKENIREIEKGNIKINKEKLKNFIPFDDVYSITEIEQKIREYKPDIVFIDFIQSIQGTGNSDYERLSNLAIGIQKIAIQYNITIFSLSQVNNDSKNTNDIVLKGSGGLFASSDVVLGLYWENGLRKLKICKNKFGKNNVSFVIEFDFEIGFIRLLQDFDNNQY